MDLQLEPRPWVDGPSSDCDPEGTARWSLNGEDQGELTGVDGDLGCEPSKDGGAVPVSGAMLLLLGARRRRRP